MCVALPLPAIRGQRFGLDRVLAAPDLVSFSQSQFMTLDAVTLRDLEVTNLSVQSEIEPYLTIVGKKKCLSSLLFSNNVHLLPDDTDT